MLPKKKRRPYRMERLDETHLEENSEAWAVSYADFLMVLLSFFILFFSLDDDKKETVIQRILAETQGRGALQDTDSPGGQGSGLGPGGGSGGMASRDPANFAELSDAAIADDLVKYNWNVEQKTEKLILHLPDNIYRLGAFQLPTPAQAQLNEVMEILSPFMDELQITFVGHADHQPVRRRRSSYLTNNFDLSVLRAANALQYFLNSGISGEHLAAKGVADFERDTRSLSIIIEPRASSRASK